MYDGSIQQLCRECQERYCQKCFASYHKKGALARHHPVLLSKATVTANCDQEDHSTPRPGGLLNGRFSEEDSAASFQEALLAWRRGEDPSSGQVGPESSKKIEKKGTHWSIHASCSVVLMSLGSKLLEIRFLFLFIVTPVSTNTTGSTGTAVSTNTSRSVESAIPSAPSSLSYMEKMLVHKHRTDPFFYRRGKNVHSSDFGVGIGEDRDFDSLSNQPSEYNIFYRPDHEQCTEQISVDKTALRAPSRVEIEEIGTELGCRPGRDGEVSDGEVSDGKVNDEKVSDGEVSDITDLSGKLPQAVVEDVSGRSNNSYDKSIKQAWSDSKRLQKESLELCSFFLAGTNGGNESREHSTTIPLSITLPQTVTLSSATSVWCPELSTAVDADTPLEEHIQLPTSVGGDTFTEDNGDDPNLEYIRPESVLATALEMEQVTAKQENDIADRDTLDQLAWELESTTGRGTPLSDHISEDSLDEDDNITANILSISMDHQPYSGASQDTTMLLQDQLSSLFNQDY